MHKKILIFCIICIYFFLPQGASAHETGLSTFFKINGVYTKPNPSHVDGATLTRIVIPKDIAPKQYLVNSNLNFEINKYQLLSLIPEDLMQRTKFTWDFGDGAKGEGFVQNHTYTKIGSYILTLTIDVYELTDTQPTRLTHSFLLHIVPSQDYRELPQAQIKVNNTTFEKDMVNSAEINFNTETTFTALNKNNNPVSVAWEFGDGVTHESAQIVKYRPTIINPHFVALRITDKNGFISDRVVRLTHNPETIKNNQVGLLQPLKNPFSLLLLIIPISIVAYLFGSKKRIVSWFLRIS